MDFNNHDENSGFDNAGNGTSNDGNNNPNNRPSDTYDTGSNGYNNNYNNTPNNNNGGYNNNGSYNNDFNNSNNNGYYNNNYDNNGFNDNNMYNNNNGTNGYAIASLVLGILSIPLGCCYGFGLILSILAIIFGIVSRKSSGGRLSGMAIGGIICAVLGIITSAVMIIGLIAFIGSSDFNSLTEIINEMEHSKYYY